MAGVIATTAPAWGQTDLPPVAAPTTSISVGTLPLVRSQSQEVTDYARGLFEGLLLRDGIPSGALVIVSHDRVDMAEVFGGDVDQNAPFALGSLSEVFGVVAAMQLAQETRLFPAEDLAAAIGEPTPRGVTLGDLLAHQVADNDLLLTGVIEHASGMAYDQYLSARILEPLGMARSRFDDGVGMIVSAGDMSQFLLALLGEGPAGDGQFLRPATIELMQRQHFSRHAAVPGWTFGFAEMERNGWRALQRDGVVMEAPQSESRIVIIPELQTSYFAVISSNGSPAFWRTLDDSLFDRLVPRRPAAGDLRTSPAPSPQEAMAAAGEYRAEPEDGVFLKIDREIFRVEADGTNLIVHGGMNLVLRPISGGAWRSEEHLIPAAFIDGVFWLGSDAYRPVTIWQKPALYLIISGLMVTLALLAFAMRARFPALMGLGVKRG